MGRFRKKYKHSQGKTVWAIHTRDYRTNNPNKCQILITVPHILSIMLLSPSNAESWAPRIRRIIFDEVHSIGNADDGVVWEQLLLLAPCPIIALSATVGNPESFNDWLETTQNSRNIKLTMVKHLHRYSDLSKFIYTPPNDCYKNMALTFTGLGRKEAFGSLDTIVGMETIHPVAALSDIGHGIPDDLALEPKDCLHLYEAMKEVATENHPVPSTLYPVEWFGNTGKVIQKVHAIEWGDALKVHLFTWMQDTNSPYQELIAVLKATQRPRGKDSIGSKVEESVFDTATVDPHELPPKIQYGTLPLLNDLHAQNALPALIFIYDRRFCEDLCSILCRELRSAEEEWRKTSPQWKKQMEEWTMRNKQASSRAAKKKVILPPGTTKEEAQRLAAEQEPSSVDNFDPNDPSRGFSFADHSKCDKQELEAHLKWMSFISESLKEGLKRGIGIHHAGMNLKYRQWYVSS